jgi:hypothetical protein
LEQQLYHGLNTLPPPAVCHLLTFLAGLSRFFADGVSPIALAPGALLPTVIAAVMFRL